MPAYTWDFDTWFVLAGTDSFGKHRFAARYDHFSADQDAGIPDRPWSHDNGNAWTLGWTWAVREHVEIAAEWLRIDSIHSTRALLGEAAARRRAQRAAGADASSSSAPAPASRRISTLRRISSSVAAAATASGSNGTKNMLLARPVLRQHDKPPISGPD